MRTEGKLVAFEGIDRAGKSSAIARLKESLSDSKVPIIICGELHSPIAPVLREMLHKGSSPFLKTYMFASDRAWEFENMCLPALERGELVLWDRYVDSAIIYRSVEFKRFSSIINLDFVRLINSPFIQPDLSIYLDISVETSIERAKQSGSIEPYDREFLNEARTQYLEIATQKGYKIVNSERPIEEVVNKLNLEIRRVFSEFFL